MKSRYMLALAILLLFGSVLGVQAATVPDTLMYEGRILDAARRPITTGVMLRFSLWKSADWVTSDTSGGSVNTGAANYGGWFETQAITPTSNGIVSAQLGSSTAFPSIDFTQHKFLQVEIKAAGQPDSSYQLLDPTGDAGTDATDRNPISSVAYAKNAEGIQNRTPGTASGNLLLLGPGGKIGIAQMGSGTSTMNFSINAGNAAGDTTLTFGNSLLPSTLRFSTTNQRFEFSTDVHIQGDLTITGQLNGIPVSSLVSTPLSVSAGAGLRINVASGSYRLNSTLVQFTGTSGVLVSDNATLYAFFGSGGLTVRTAAFPTDESYIPLAKVITSGGAVSSIQDYRALQTDTREAETATVLHAPYNGASLQADGTSNVGELYVTHDGTAARNFYLWTSEESTLQDYDVVLPVTLPPNFVRWRSNPLVVHYRSTSAANTDNKLDIQVLDTNGQPVTLGGSASNLAATSWASTTLTFTGSPTWTAGQTVLIKGKLSAKSNFQIHLATVELHYEVLHSK